MAKHWIVKESDIVEVKLTFDRALGDGEIGVMADIAEACGCTMQGGWLEYGLAGGNAAVCNAAVRITMRASQYGVEVKIEDYPPDDGSADLARDHEFARMQVER